MEVKDDLGAELRRLHEEAADIAESSRIRFLIIDMFSQVYLDGESAPNLENVGNYINSNKSKLKEADLSEFREIWARLADYFPKKSIEEIIEEVFPGGKWLDEEERPKVKQLAPKISEGARSKVKAIEAEALSKGWVHEQLWHIPDYPRYDQMGLICFIDDHTTIGKVTEKYIALIKVQLKGDSVTNYFYNMKVEQPWITKPQQKLTFSNNFVCF